MSFIDYYTQRMNTATFLNFPLLMIVLLALVIIYGHMGGTTYQRFLRIHSDIKRDAKGSRLKVLWVAFRRANGWRTR